MLADKDAALAQAKRKELAQGYADRALAQLRQAVARGFKDADRMKQGPHLEALRARPDFGKLLAELEGKAAIDTCNFDHRRDYSVVRACEQVAGAAVAA